MRLMEQRYQPGDFEHKWASLWEADGIYRAPDSPVDKPKRFVMEMFPYPSGDLHVGHVENYAIADAMARFWRMRGFEVMHPMGYDAFGLPAENAAMKRGIHPKDWTESNISKMRSSFKRLGFSYDWGREVVSCDPAYYRWNQWFFLRFFERGLAYRKKSPVNWCPSCKTVLAKEQLSTGVCWRCGSVPEVKDLTQWFLKITDYSDRLLDDMERLNWPDSILSQQRHWIGRSAGAEVTFEIKPHSGTGSIEFPVFTTRPDTLWGATFLVIAPEHPVAAAITKGTSSEKAFEVFLDEVRRSSEVERQSSEGTRRGMALPATAINPVNGEQIDVWIGDYVLMGYGTGGIMAVPAHDQRDFEFAKQYGLKVRPVIQPEGQTLDAETMSAAYPGAGVMVDSGPFDGTVVVPETQDGITDVISWLEESKLGRGTIQYRQRDWLVSRQRYWGTPIPIIHCDRCGEVPVPEEDLPVLLPDSVDYDATEGTTGPLANQKEWVEVACPKCGGDAKRETDTLDTFFDSSWYFLRYCDPTNSIAPFDPEKVKAWLPVDFYFGGTEHAVMHLIYARFFVKALQDMGLLDFSEPFLTLFNQGYVWLEGQEMSKSTGHIIEAAEVIETYGADSARTFMLFCSPPEADYDFPEGGKDAFGKVAFNWLARVWRIVGNVENQPPSEQLDRVVHRTVKAVTEEFENFGLNTGIARLMELVNHFSKLGGPVPRASAETFLKLLAPIAPFIAEELWHRLDNIGSIHLAPWPEFDPIKAELEKVTMVVQVNGKVRDKMDVDASISREQMQELALSSQRVVALLQGQEPSKVIVVPPKLVNVVV